MVLALQDRLAYGPTFEAALTSLFGGGASSLSGSEATHNSAGASAQPRHKPANRHARMIAEAAKDFNDYQRLTAAGKLGEAGQKLDALKQVIDKLNAQH